MKQALEINKSTNAWENIKGGSQDIIPFEAIKSYTELPNIADLINIALIRQYGAS